LRETDPISFLLTVR